jgi:membrane-bound serine protease (ClpP class)
VDIRVIDVLAPSVQDLLTKINGRTVEVQNRKVTLVTKGASIVEREMPFRYRFLSVVSDPNVAYILMMIGFFGILFEIYSPGAILPGVLGGISLILAFYAFQAIPINYAGLALILLGVVFFILELEVTSYGLLSMAGVASIILGSIMLIDLPPGWLAISWSTILAVAVVSVLFFVGILSYVLKAQRLAVRTGKEALMGETGIALTRIAPTGKVSVHGEYWDAESSEPIEQGERIVVTELLGLKIKVRKEDPL